MFERVRERTILRERLINEVRIGMIEGKQVAKRQAGKGSREQDLAGEPSTSSITCFSVSGEKVNREDVVRHSGKTTSRLDRSVRSGRDS